MIDVVVLAALICGAVLYAQYAHYRFKAKQHALPELLELKRALNFNERAVLKVSEDARQECDTLRTEIKELKSSISVLNFKEGLRK